MVLATSEANSGVRGPMCVSLVASSDVRVLGGATGVVLATSEASGGMGSDVSGQGGAMGVSLVDSSDVRGLGGAMGVSLVASSDVRGLGGGNGCGFSDVRG